MAYSQRGSGSFTTHNGGIPRSSSWDESNYQQQWWAPQSGSFHGQQTGSMYGSQAAAQFSDPSYGGTARSRPSRRTSGLAEAPSFGSFSEQAPSLVPSVGGSSANSPIPQSGSFFRGSALAAKKSKVGPQLPEQRRSRTAAPTVSGECSHPTWARARPVSPHPARARDHVPGMCQHQCDKGPCDKAVEEGLWCYEDGADWTPYKANESALIENAFVGGKQFIQVGPGRAVYFNMAFEASHSGALERRDDGKQFPIRRTGLYCVEHKCERDGCHNERRHGAQFCSLHGISRSNADGMSPVPSSAPRCQHRGCDNFVVPGSTRCQLHSSPLDAVGPGANIPSPAGSTAYNNSGGGWGGTASPPGSAERCRHKGCSLIAQANGLCSMHICPIDGHEKRTSAKDCGRHPVNSSSTPSMSSIASNPSDSVISNISNNRGSVGSGGSFIGPSRGSSGALSPVPPQRSTGSSFGMPLDAIDRCINMLLAARNAPPNTNILSEPEITSLCASARACLMSQPMLLEVQEPLRICGDTHGQFGDLLRIFDLTGQPNYPSTRYLFLGDYVDRGAQSTETISLLLAYKLKFPNGVWLLRGNHEAANITKMYGFFDECKRRYSVKLWKIFVDMFNCMPVAAIVSSRIFCMHGGISPDLENFDQIRNLPRPSDVPEQGLFLDLLWADPDSNIPGWSFNDQRGVSWRFGAGALGSFLEKHKLDMIARAHEVVEQGYAFFEGSNRQLVTIFSAPNYCGEFNNAAGVMIIAEGLRCSFRCLPANGATAVPPPSTITGSAPRGRVAAVPSAGSAVSGQAAYQRSGRAPSPAPRPVGARGPAGPSGQQAYAASGRSSSPISGMVSSVSSAMSAFRQSGRAPSPGPPASSYWR